ncbi:MAG: pyrroline-5-carboxylate reductase [Thermoguttaceae bacterium]
MLPHRIGFIGAGQMATALAQGLLKAGLVQPDRILASDPAPEARERFARTTGVKTSSITSDNLHLVADSDSVFIAVKPQQVAGVLSQIRGYLGPDKLVISLAAGIRLAALAEGLGPQVRLVRVMPNTPCLVGQGACAYCLGERATAEDEQLVRQMLGAVGMVLAVEERLMDAVTGLSGSGPALGFVIIEALADGGVRMGLPRQVALALAAQTLRGAAEMVLATGEHPAVLKDRVASPAGTTIAGLRVVESGAVRGTLMAAVEAAARRAAELAAGS